MDRKSEEKEGERGKYRQRQIEADCTDKENIYVFSMGDHSW